MISCWIQTSDFESTDIGTVDARAATETFNGFDWTSEESRRAQMEREGRETCDSGMGLVSEDGRILHIGPTGHGKAFLHYHYPERRRILGIPLWKTQMTISNFDIEQSDIDEIIARFFRNDHSWLLQAAA